MKIAIRKMSIKSFLPIILFSFLFVLPFVGLYVIIKYQNTIIKDTVSETIPPQNIAITPKASASDSAGLQAHPINVANWKTYSNPNGYAMKIPQEMKISSQQGFDSQFNNSDLLISIGIFGLQQDKTIDDYVRYGLCLSDPTHATIHNKTVTKSETRYNNTNICEDAVFKLSDYTVLDLQGKANNQAGVDLYNQILSTVQVTN